MPYILVKYSVFGASHGGGYCSDTELDPNEPYYDMGMFLEFITMKKLIMILDTGVA
jgi:hypothetical protein